MSFLVDTDTITAHLKRPGEVASRFIQYSGRLHVSMISVGELLTWAQRHDAPPRRLLAIRELLGQFVVLPIDESVAEVFAKQRSAQLDSGRLSPATDLWIAATAIAHDLTLVTHNGQDFRFVRDLSLDDWLNA